MISAPSAGNEPPMDATWNDSQPIYRQLRDRVVAMILEGALKEGDPLPSVRTVAAEFRLNPLTVLKGYQQLVDELLVEKRRGRGMYVAEGATTRADEGRTPALSRHRMATRLRDDPAPRLQRPGAARDAAGGPRRARRTAATGTGRRRRRGRRRPRRLKTLRISKEPLRGHSDRSTGTRRSALARPPRSTAPPSRSSRGASSA